MSTVSPREVLRSLGLQTAPGDAVLTGGMSGSSLISARTGAGVCVAVKVSTLDSETAVDQVERELGFYTQVAPVHAVPSPQLVGHHREEGWSAIALTRHEPSPPPDEWTREQWCELAQALGRLHSTVRSVPGVLSTPPPEDHTPYAEQLSSARRLWHGPGDDQRVAAVMRDLATLKETARTGPHSFVHGDCHTENVLVGRDGRLLLADWQSAHVGPTAADLAFAFTRAAPFGTAIAYHDVIAAYCETADVDAAVTARCVAAHQLVIHTAQYPAYADFLSEDQVAHLRTEFDRALEAWSSGE